MSNQFTINGQLLNVAVLDGAKENAKDLSHWISEVEAQHALFSSTEMFLKSLRRTSFNLIILYWDRCVAAPGQNAVTRIRKTLKSNTPVLVVSENSDEKVMVEALYSGADNYLVWPMRRLEFMARLQALIRRTQPEPEVFSYPPYHLDVRNRVVRLNDEVIRLTTREYQLAELLFRHRGSVLSREQLLISVDRLPTVTNSRVIDTHISRLRVKLKIPDTECWSLKAVYQQGYRLTQERISI